MQLEQRESENQRIIVHSFMKKLSACESSVIVIFLHSILSFDNWEKKKKNKKEQIRRESFEFQSN